MSTHTDGSVCPGCELKLEDAHPSLAYWFRNRVKPKYPTAHISWSFRDKPNQDQCVLDGKSELHWPHSKHNYTVAKVAGQAFTPYIFGPNSKACALALDLFEISPDAPKGKWDPKFYANVNADVEAAGIPIKWGGKWKSIGDGDHFQWEGPLE